jgi:hypothetical protein
MSGSYWLDPIARHHLSEVDAARKILQEQGATWDGTAWVSKPIEGLSEFDQRRLLSEYQRMKDFEHDLARLFELPMVDRGSILHRVRLMLGPIGRRWSVGVVKGQA